MKVTKNWPLDLETVVSLSTWYNKYLVGEYGTWTLSLKSSPWALQSSFFTVAAACLMNLFTPQTMDCNNELSIRPHGSITIQVATQRSIVQL